jgi:hypothetical protein
MIVPLGCAVCATDHMILHYAYTIQDCAYTMFWITLRDATSRMGQAPGTCGRATGFADPALSRKAQAVMGAAECRESGPDRRLESGRDHAG